MSPLEYVDRCRQLVIPAKAGIQNTVVIPAKAGIQHTVVIPAKAGIHFGIHMDSAPAFAGVTFVRRNDDSCSSCAMVDDPVNC